jgi:hypothetical protein
MAKEESRVFLSGPTGITERLRNCPDNVEENG